MRTSVEAIIDEDGRIHFQQPIHLTRPCRVLLTVLDDGDQEVVPESALLSQQALQDDWDNPDEDAAWAHLR